MQKHVSIQKLTKFIFVLFRMPQTWKNIWIFDFGPVIAYPHKLNQYVFSTFYLCIFLMTLLSKSW